MHQMQPKFYHKYCLDRNCLGNISVYSSKYDSIIILYGKHLAMNYCPKNSLYESVSLFSLINAYLTHESLLAHAPTTV